MDFNAQFAAAHSETRMDQILKAHGAVARPVVALKDPCAASMEKIPLEMQYLVPELDAEDFSESTDPLTKLFSDIELNTAMGIKSSLPSQGELSLAEMLKALRDEDDETEKLLAGRVALPAAVAKVSEGGDDELKKWAHKKGLNAVQEWLAKKLEEGETLRDLIEYARANSGEAAALDLVKQAEGLVAKAA